ncbi:MAG: M14 family metallopeptidase [Niastella sp.]|nr:M14 family metallopeptidase [Niastella sp.]
MKSFILFFILMISLQTGFAQLTPFEKSGGLASATYFQAIDWYRQLAKKSKQIKIKTMGQTDAGYPLHVVLLSADASFEPRQWKKQNKVVYFILNGIHPGEPDGIDASMMLARDYINKKIKLPTNVVIALIPVYNIGGALNRNAYSRVNQNGPLQYGFRGNAQNLDLNRDFTKCDSRNAKSFIEIFHYLQPDVFIDTHVSDGADYQHTMTLITTQYDKLGGELGQWLKNDFEPAIYADMKKKNWDLIPYVDFGNTDFSKGMKMFNETPRYSSGYAALFNTIGFISETHMLKPFKDRVLATYDLLKTLADKTSQYANTIIEKRKKANKLTTTQNQFALSWECDSSQTAKIEFKGYESDSMMSQATGLMKMFYNHQKPFTRFITFYNSYRPANFITAPKTYIIKRGYYAVADLLALNGVKMRAFQNDTTILVTAYKIDSYKSYTTPYEKHHKNFNVTLQSSTEAVHFLKGDYIIDLNQPGNRFIIEMLEPMGDDSYFSWNFFDGILQQKEGYSDYRWDELAAEVLKKDMALQHDLETRKKNDARFAKNSNAILDFIYRHSPYFENAFKQYPVYRIEHSK